MLIQELTREECLKVLSHTRTSRLACVHKDQPYIVPVYLAYDAATPDAPSLYGVTTLGTKVEWIRANPRVCVEVDDITDFDKWVSVVVLGRYEELEGQPKVEEVANPLRRPTPPIEESREPSSHATGKLKAFEILHHQAMWWEPSSTAWSSRPGRTAGQTYDPSILPCKDRADLGPPCHSRHDRSLVRSCFGLVANDSQSACAKL